MWTVKAMSNYLFFYSKHSPLSNWYPAEFVWCGIKFANAEQAMMWAKAKHFEDQEIADKLVNTTDPSTCKRLGRQVKNFIDSEWDAVRQDIVFELLVEKFGQNEDIKQLLLRTTGKELVEASPRDRVWGIGMGANNPDAQDKSKWRGRNLLGKTLDRVRAELETR